MTTTIVRYARRPVGDRRPVEQLFVLGEACFQPTKGWRFFPRVSGREPSRKFYPTLEACLPRWVGYPDSCESYYARYNGVLVSPDWGAPAPELRSDVNADLLAALKALVEEHAERGPGLRMLPMSRQPHLIAQAMRTIKAATGEVPA
jgi:hypothetical protein